MEPQVSVIIATYNYGRFIREAIESALAQTFGNFEIAVIDDGSTDNTWDVVRPYLDDKRLRYHKTNHLGQPGAKNTGIRLTSAPLVAFLDADDIWLPTKLEKQIGVFRANPEVGVVYSRNVLIDEEGRLVKFNDRQLHRGSVLHDLFLTSFVCFSTSVVRREVLDQVGVFDESINLAIDFDLWLRVALRYRFDFVDEPLVKYRTGHANLSKRLPERLRCVRIILDRFLDTYGGRTALGPRLVRQGMADHYCDAAEILGKASWRRGLANFGRALAIKPHHWPAWRRLLSYSCPEEMKDLLRKIVGRTDWRQRQHAETGG